MTRVADQDLSRRFATRAVHAGYVGDPLSGAVMGPIYQTSTYIQEALGRNKGCEYARTRNPTREALDHQVLERPLRHGRRHAGDDPGRHRRADWVYPELVRRGSGPLRLLARTARHQNAGAAHAPA